MKLPRELPVGASLAGLEYLGHGRRKALPRRAVVTLAFAVKMIESHTSTQLREGTEPHGRQENPEDFGFASLR